VASTAQINVVADTSQAERALGNVTSALKSIAGIAIGAGVAKSLLDIASNAQELTNKLISVSGSLGEANVKFGLVAATAQKTGSSIGGTADLYQKLAQSSTFAGSSTESLLKVTENFNKTLQISGASGAAASSALYQFAQAMQKGSLNGDEFRTITETNGYLLKILQKELNVSATELRQMASDGRLSAEIVGKALFGADQIAKDYGKTIKTIPQAFENLQTQIMVTVKALDDSTGATAMFVSVIETIGKNLDIIIGIAAGFFAAFAVGRIIAIATAVMEVVAALRAMSVMTAIASGGLALVLGAAAGFAAYKATEEAMKKIAEDAEAARKAAESKNTTDKAGLVITHQRVTQALDLDKALKEQIGLLKASNDLESTGNGIRDLQLEVSKAVAAEAEKYKKTGESMLPALAAQLAAETQRKILNDERLTVTKELLGIAAQNLQYTTQDVNEGQIAVQLEQFRLSVTKETFALRKAEFETAVRQTKQLAAQYEITKSNNAEMAKAKISGIIDPKAAQIELTILDRRNQYGSAYTAELEKQDRLAQSILFDLQQQMSVQKTLGDLTRAQTPSEVATRAAGAFGGTQEGMAVEQARQQEAVKMLKDQGLINDKSYADQRVLMEKSAMDQILAYEQNVSEQRMRLAGVTNQGIIDAVKAQQANVQMIQQGGIVGAQGMLGAMDQVFSAMGQNNKKAFETHKKLAVAQALISTYQAAAAALAMPPGPPISLIYVAGAIAAGMAQIANINSQQYSGKATGGPVAGGMPYIVGEKGPEIFTPTTSGNITPNDQLGAGGSVNVNFTINAVDATSFDSLLVNRKGVITQIISDAMLEKGQRGL
jgi:tape measure domain-containing protein